MVEMMLEAEYLVNTGMRGLRHWQDTDVKGRGVGMMLVGRGGTC